MQQQSAAETDGDAVHRRDERQRVRLQRGEELLVEGAALGPVLDLGGFTEVGAGAEGVSALR